MNRIVTTVLITIFISLCGSSPTTSREGIEFVNISLTATENGIKITVTQKDLVVLSGFLNLGKDVSSISCVGQQKCQIDDATLTIDQTIQGIKISWETPNKSLEFLDCFDLQEGVFWYGGPQRRVQTWPLNKMVINGSLPYVSRRDDNFAVAERYWLSSNGVFIAVEDTVPLFVDQNSRYGDKVCFSARLQEPYINRERNILDYYVGFDVDLNPRSAHLKVINNFLGLHSGHPNKLMISQPIWTTWAKYYRDISDSVVLDFAKMIKENGYGGQIEIDDKWETCYGSQKFDQTKFPDIANTVKTLKEMGFRVTLWTHPFVNSDCTEVSEEGLAKGYFVVDQTNGTKASWWNGDDARQIDFTNAEAAEWWAARMRKLVEETGIDGLKCDAGETDYGAGPSGYETADPEKVPNIFTSSYIRTCAQFGDLIEVRSASRTQDLPIFVRMLDKDSNWKLDNGLPTLVTTLLQLNMNGYTMVLPDIIGGNGYNMETPSAELLVRWTQATALMPAMQFSILPWEISKPDFDAPAIIKRFVDLHQNYSDVILAAMAENIRSGMPVNAPIWWTDPYDEVALACDDEFLLGGDVLVAPILTEGATSRKVYLPKGTWQDANDNTVHQGPVTLDYVADINTLPYFKRIAQL